MSWIVRKYAHDGSVSDITEYEDQRVALWHAASLNFHTKSRQYKVEEKDDEQ